MGDSRPVAAPEPLARSVQAGEASSSPRPILELKGVTQRFGGRVVLQNLSWRLLPGESAVILGPSGAGKSVFLSILLGFLRPDKGSVDYGGHATDDLFARLAVLFQEDTLFDDRDVETNLAMALLERGDLLAGPFPPETTLRIEAALRDVGLDPTAVARLPPRNLSGGMRRRVALARALLRAPQTLVADEPTSGLDRRTSEAIYDLMAGLIRRRGMNAVIVTHDPLCALRLGEPIYYFTPRGGSLARFEPPADQGTGRPTVETLTDWIESVREERPEPVAGGSRPETPPLEAAAREWRRTALSGVEAVGRAVMAARVALRPPSRRLLAQHLIHWGLKSLPLTILIFALLGVVAEVQAERSIAELGFSNRLPELMGLFLARLAPIMSAFLLAGRCGSAVTAHLGWMELSGQRRGLVTLRIDPERTFFPPLLWGWALILPGLAWVGMLAGGAAAWGFIASGLSRAEITPRFFVNEALAALEPALAASILIKTLLMSVGLATAAYVAGTRPKRSATDVTRAITLGLVVSFIWISLVDATVSLALPT